MSGRVLGGRYRAEQLLGSGGMGTVWRGRDLRLDRPVAIKVLAGAGLDDPMAFERFDREARAVARLAHPNIVAVHDFSADRDDPYLVMELVEGRAVGAILADGALPLAQALAIAIQTCDGLTAAHTAGVIHRDIKPANLILTPSGVVKICDFGIARLQHAVGLAKLTGTATILGTSAYMAPEQIAGEPVDGRTDLYALGCTTYAMLTGAPPFVGESPVSIVQQHLNQQPAPLQTRRADVPAAIDALVDELLAKDPADRPANAEQVRARLAVLSGEAAVASPGPTARPSAVPDAVVAAGAGTAPPNARALARTLVDTGGGYQRANRRRRVGLAAMVGVTSLAMLSLVAAITTWNSGRAHPTAERQPSAPPANTLAVPTSAAPSLDPVRTTVPARPSTSVQRSSPVRTTSTTPRFDPIAAMRASIQRQVHAGQLNPTAAEDLHKKIDELARAVNTGDTNETGKKTEDLREKLDRLRHDGKLSSIGYDELVAYLDQLPAVRP